MDRLLLINFNVYLGSIGLEIWQLTATELRHQISKGEISAREATESHLSRMNQVNGKLNAVIESCETEALQEADLVDDKRHKEMNSVHLRVFQLL